REFRNSEIYHEWFVPWETEHELEIGIPSPPWHTKTFSFTRSRDWPDFEERDRSLLDVLQPHLVHLYRNARLRQRLLDEDDGAASSSEAWDLVSGGLGACRKQREVVALKGRLLLWPSALLTAAAIGLIIAPASAGKKSSSPAKGGKHVLLVDDDKAQCKKADFT